MKIAVTSRSFSKHPLLRAELLNAFPDVKFNELGKAFGDDDLVDFLQGFDAAITGLERLNADVLAKLPALKVVSKYGVGLDMIDLNAMRRLNKRLGWQAGVNKTSVAEIALCQIIALLRRTVEANRRVLGGDFTQIPGKQLSGASVGIIGCGQVGKELVRMLAPFNCSIFVHDIVEYHDFYSEHSIKPVSLDELLRQSEIVSLHVPLDDSTRRMLNGERLSKMRQGAYLVNYARGGIVDEQALKQMLMNGHIAGAAFDVFEPEPPLDMELLSLRNFVATPHIGGSTEEAIVAMGRAAIAGLRDNQIPAM